MKKNQTPVFPELPGGQPLFGEETKSDFRLAVDSAGNCLLCGEAGRCRMKTYRIQFQGRENGSIGVTCPIEKTVVAESKEEALKKLYETHEHIQQPIITEVKNVRK